MDGGVAEGQGVPAAGQCRSDDLDGRTPDQRDMLTPAGLIDHAGGKCMPSFIRVTCACGKTLRVPAHLKGKRVECPACGAANRVSADRPPSPEVPVDAPAVYVHCTVARPAIRRGDHLRVVGAFTCTRNSFTPRLLSVEPPAGKVEKLPAKK